MKGKTTCNRTACQRSLIDGAIYYNSSTKANYCPDCAYLINKHNTNLCKLQPPKESTSFGHTLEVERLIQKLREMHPSDGLHSPRDIELAKEINRFSAFIDEIKANTKE